MEGFARAAKDAGPVDLLVNKVAKKKQISTETARDRINDKMQKGMSLLQLANIVLLAVVLRLVFWRRYYVEHLVFAAHYLSFTYLLSLFWWPFYVSFGVDPVTRFGLPVAIVVMLWYTFASTRRMYAQSKVRTGWKTPVVVLSYYAVQMFMLFVPLIIAIFMIIRK
jgi:hypothetical protein